eukprot:9081454-Pyramimonas_sp.AAC.1
MYAEPIAYPLNPDLGFITQHHTFPRGRRENVTYTSHLRALASPAVHMNGCALRAPMVLTVGAPPHLQEAFKINAFEPCTGNIPRALMRVALTMGLPKLIVGE